MALSKYFYNQTIKKYTYGFGALFNDIKIKRKNSSNQSVYEQIVPLVYSNKHKFVLRKNEETNLGDKKFQLTLPRMGYSLVGLSYDPERKKTSSIKYRNAISSDNNKMNRMYEPIPYILNYELYIKTRDQEDLFQIIEQIIPFFKPSLNLSMNIMNNIGLIYDIPYILNSIDLNDSYETDFTENREILSTLTFECQGWLFGPVTAQPIIKFANVNVYSTKTSNSNLKISDEEISTIQQYGDSAFHLTIRPTKTSANTPTSNLQNSVALSEINPDDNFGIIVIKQ